MEQSKKPPRSYKDLKQKQKAKMGGNGVRAVGGSTSMNKRNSVK